MHDACGDRDHVPHFETQRRLMYEIDLQRPVDHDEQLIRIRMKVPGVFHLECGQSQTALIHAIDHHIAIGLGARGSLRGEVEHPERRMKYALRHEMGDCWKS